MNRLGRAAVLLCLGVVISHLTLSGSFGVFVQQRMRIPLGVAAVVLLALGLSEAIAVLRLRDPDISWVRRSVGPWIGWLLVLPVLVLIAAAPTGLGAAAADRVEAVTPMETASSFSPLQATAEPLELGHYEFLDRVLWDDGRGLENQVIRLEGLVVRNPSFPDGFLLTRFMVSCCAADGVPLQVAVRGPHPELPEDTWVVAEVTWRPPAMPYADLDGPWWVEVDTVSIMPATSAPADPYESPY